MLYLSLIIPKLSHYRIPCLDARSHSGIFDCLPLSAMQTCSPFEFSVQITITISEQDCQFLETVQCAAASETHMQEVYTSRDVCSRCDESHVCFRARAAGSMPTARSQAAAAESSTSRSCWCRMRVTEPPSSKYEPGPARTAHTPLSELLPLLLLSLLLPRCVLPCLLLMPVWPSLCEEGEWMCEGDLQGAELGSSDASPAGLDVVFRGLKLTTSCLECLVCLDGGLYGGSSAAGCFTTAWPSLTLRCRSSSSSLLAGETVCWFERLLPLPLLPLLLLLPDLPLPCLLLKGRESIGMLAQSHCPLAVRIRNSGAVRCCSGDAPST